MIDRGRIPEPGKPVPLISPVVTIGEVPLMVGAGSTRMVTCFCSGAPASPAKYWKTVIVYRPDGALKVQFQVWLSGMTQ